LRLGPRSQGSGLVVASSNGPRDYFVTGSTLTPGLRTKPRVTRLGAARHRRSPAREVSSLVDVEVRRVHAADWKQLREVRLRALADAPDSFASTLEREAAFSEDVWRQRAEGGPGSVTFIAGADGVAVGMAAVIAEPVPGRAQLVGMWVDPRHRRRGLAQALIGHAVRWSRGQQASELVAWVAEPNTAARMLYGRVGFRPAGARQPLPSNPAVDEVLLRLPLDRPLQEG
jgi:GNAT superfamily N-acetyltransferase